MNSEIKAFVKKLMILASIIGICIIITVLIISPQYVTPTLPFLLIFHTAATLISFLYIHKKTEKAPNKFINVYLTNTTVKLLLYLAILIIYGIYNIADAVNFIVSFFILYLIFTVFEVFNLLKANRRLHK
jgi:hypothetical protein